MPAVGFLSTRLKYIKRMFYKLKSTKEEKKSNKKKKKNAFSVVYRKWPPSNTATL